MSEPWHLRKELSIGTIVSLVVLGFGSIGAYYTAMAQIEQNAKQLQGVPDRITRLEERLAQLQNQQSQLRADLAAAAAENRESNADTTQALQAILVAIARIEAQLDE